jgi:uncharacterized membrane protein
VTPNRAFLLAIPFVLAVETGLFYALAALGANGQLAVAVEMIWLVVAVFLTVLFVGHFEHEGSDDRAG